MVIPLSILIFYFFLSPHYTLIHTHHQTYVFVYLPLHSLTLIHPGKPAISYLSSQLYYNSTGPCVYFSRCIINSPVSMCTFDLAFSKTSYHTQKHKKIDTKSQSINFGFINR